MTTHDNTFEVTPDLIRQKKLGFYVVYPLTVLLGCLWGTFLEWYSREYLDLNAPSPDVYRGDQRLKRFCFMLRIVDKDSGMDIPFSAESDEPLYNVVQGNLYSPDNDAYNFTNPEIEYTQATKKNYI